MAALGRNALSRLRSTLMPRRQFSTSETKKGGHGTPGYNYEAKYDESFYFEPSERPIAFTILYTIFCVTGSMVPIWGAQNQQQRMVEP